jgi:hypothetical protein
MIVDNGYSHGFSKNLFLSIAEKRLFGKTKTAEPGIPHSVAGWEVGIALGPDFKGV